MADAGEGLQPYSTVAGHPNCRVVSHLFGQLGRRIRQRGLDRVTLDDVFMSMEKGFG